MGYYIFNFTISLLGLFSERFLYSYSKAKYIMIKTKPIFKKMIEDQNMENLAQIKWITCLMFLCGLLENAKESRGSLLSFFFFFI